jgi:hypothetical protein
MLNAPVLVDPGDYFTIYRVVMEVVISLIRGQSHIDIE